MVKSPVRGCILANEVGTGKTATFLAERSIAIEERLRALESLNMAEDEDVTSVDLPATMPTLLIAPANVVEQHFNEATNYFPAGYFHLRSFHGTVNNTSHNPALAKVIMSETQLYAEMELAVEQKNTSQVCYSVRSWHPRVRKLYGFSHPWVPT